MEDAGWGGGGCGCFTARAIRKVVNPDEAGQTFAARHGGLAHGVALLFPGSLTILDEAHSSQAETMGSLSVGLDNEQARESGSGSEARVAASVSEESVGCVPPACSTCFKPGPGTARHQRTGCSAAWLHLGQLRPSLSGGNGSNKKCKGIRLGSLVWL